MSTLSSANVTDVNLVLKECTHKIKIKYSMHQYSNSYAYFRQLAHRSTSMMTGSALCSIQLHSQMPDHHFGGDVL